MDLQFHYRVHAVNRAVGIDLATALHSEMGSPLTKEEKKAATEHLPERGDAWYELKEQ